jgi:hypothetical protein
MHTWRILKLDSVLPHILHSRSFLVASFLSKAKWVGRAMAQAVSTGLLLRSAGFASGSILVGFVVDKVTLGQVFLRVFRFPLSISFHRRSPYSYIMWVVNNMSVNGSSSGTTPSIKRHDVLAIIWEWGPPFCIHLRRNSSGREALLRNIPYRYAFLEKISKAKKKKESSPATRHGGAWGERSIVPRSRMSRENKYQYESNSGMVYRHIPAHFEQCYLEIPWMDWENHQKPQENQFPGREFNSGPPD